MLTVLVANNEVFLFFPQELSRNLKVYLTQKIPSNANRTLGDRLRNLACPRSMYRPSPLLDSFMQLDKNEMSTIPYQTLRRVYEGDGRSINHGPYCANIDYNKQIFTQVFQPIVENELRNWFDIILRGVVQRVTEGWDADRDRAILAENQATLVQNLMGRIHEMLDTTWQDTMPVLEEHMLVLWRLQREVGSRDQRASNGLGHLGAVKTIMLNFITGTGANGAACARAMFLAMLEVAERSFVENALVVFEWVLTCLGSEQFEEGFEIEFDI